MLQIDEIGLLTKVADASSAATSDVTSTGVNMAGFRDVVFFSSYGTAAANNLPHAEQSSDDGSTDTYADLTGTAVGVSTSDEDVWLRISQPREQYVRTVWERGTSSTLGDIWALRLGARSYPQDNTIAGTIHGEGHVRPAEGTK